MASRSAIFFVIFNIAFSTLTHAQNLKPLLYIDSNLHGGSCDADPVGLTACGVLISGNFSPFPIRSCCNALSSLSTKEAEVCLRNAVENEAAKISNVDAVHTALTVCNKI
ncbi:hypothetical protein POM88_010230 [Heracleum sosnowskyi]|uniref:Bifunctional inhibitor/plant lipid transfer protein/seed storage helical domain-containing protein n=1 Tax=Heracleum sosnowskyi TaxID=360622 RepID=A0AAD8N8W9_9APIA|nr:hypothetical protein POM88_010230 [Heracleum sosnowskyi]